MLYTPANDSKYFINHAYKVSYIPNSDMYTQNPKIYTIYVLARNHSEVSFLIQVTLDLGIPTCINELGGKIIWLT